jgi:hypothetical protein
MHATWPALLLGEGGKMLAIRDTLRSAGAAISVVNFAQHAVQLRARYIAAKQGLGQQMCEGTWV